MKQIFIPIQIKILALIGLLLVSSSFGLSWLISQSFLEENQNLILELNTQSTIQSAEEVRSFFDKLGNQLKSLSKDFYSRRHLEHGSEFASVALVQNQSGQMKIEKILVAANSSLGPGIENLLTSTSNLIDFAEPQVFSIGEKQAKKYIALAIPLFEANREYAGRALLGIFEIQKFNAVIPEEAAGTQFLVDSAGRFICELGGNDLGGGVVSTQRPSVLAFLNRSSSSGQARSQDSKLGGSLLSSYSYIQKFHVGFISEVSENVAFGTSAKVSHRTKLFALVFFCLALILGSLYSETITSRLTRLVEATTILEKGSFEIDLPTKTRDEVGTLSESFLSMAKNLKTQQEALLNQEKLVVAGRMARNIGHEFGNVLQPLMTKLELLQEELAESNQQEHCKKLEEMIEITTYGAGICQGLLTLSRETREVHVSKLFGIKAMCEKATRLLAHELKKKDVKVLFEIPDDLVIFGNESQIMQIIVNLMVNSTHAMNSQGQIILRAQVNGDFTRLEVADNGSGISAENLKKIFEPLFSTKGSKGNGLGLSISRTIMEQHGGSMEVASTVGVGTTMILIFPKASNSQEAAA